MLRKMAEDVRQREAPTQRETTLRDAGTNALLVNQKVEELAKEDFDSMTEESASETTKKASALSPDKTKKLIVLLLISAVLVAIFVFVVLQANKPKAPRVLKQDATTKTLTLGNPLVSEAPKVAVGVSAPVVMENHSSAVAKAVPSTVLNVPPQIKETNSLQPTSKKFENLQAAEVKKAIKGAPVEEIKPTEETASSVEYLKLIKEFQTELKKSRTERIVLQKKIRDLEESNQEVRRLRKELEKVQKSSERLESTTKQNEAELAATKNSLVKKSSLVMLDSKSVEINGRIYQIGEKIRYGSDVYVIDKIDVEAGVYVQNSIGKKFMLKEK